MRNSSNKFERVLMITLLNLVLTCSYVWSQSPFAINGWQLHEYNIPKLEDAIAKAPEYGVNTIVFSHELFRSVESYLNSPEHQRDIAHIAKLAAEKQIDYYMWVHELDDIPPGYRASDGRVDMDNKKLYPFLEQRYTRLLETLPGIAGFILTFHESGAKVFKNTEVKTTMGYADRIYTITKLIYEVARKKNKKLIIRNFLYEPKEIEYYEAALEKLPDDIILMAKDTPHEFDPFYPPDPHHGQNKSKKQLMELDLGVEKSWGYPGAYAQVEYIQRYVKRARDKKMTGLIGRARLYWDKPFEDAHEINLYAFHRFINNPDEDIEKVWSDWALRHFPANAAPHIISALKRTQFINHNGRYHLGFWLTKYIGEDWDSYEYYFSHIRSRSLYKWSRDPQHKALEAKLYRPDEVTYRQLVDEKKEVLAQTWLCLKDIEKAARYLTSNQLTPIKNSFLFLERCGDMELQFTRAFFAHRRWMENPLPAFEEEVNEALKQLEKMEKPQPALYDRNKQTGEYLPMEYYVNAFIAKIRERMKDREASKKEDEKIMAKLEADLNQP